MSNPTGKRQEIGFIGLGHMGGAIARRMLQAGTSLVAFDINPAALDAIAAAGALRAGSVKEVADRASLVLACLPTGGNLDVAREAAGGASLQIYAELSTMRPATIRIIEEIMTARNVALIDAPVSGGVTIAERGALSLMMAGPQVSMDRLAEALKSVTAHVFRIGGRPGQAQLCKLLNNAIGFTVFLASCEALVVGASGGIDPSRLLDAINAGEGRNSWTVDKFRQHILSRTFDAGAKLQGGPPALDLYLGEARAVGMPPGLVARARDTWATIIEAMDPTVDFTNMIQYFERFTGTRLAAGERIDPGAISLNVPPRVDVIGFIGLGQMGAAIVRRLLAQGIAVAVFDTDQGALDRLVSLGARAVGSPREAADCADILMVCLPSGEQCTRVAKDVAGGGRIRTYVELSTVGRQALRRIREILSPSPIELVDAPVSGTPGDASQGMLELVLSGPPSACEIAAKAATYFAREVIVIGDEPGQAQLCKLVDRAIGLTAFLVSCEVIAAGVWQGIDTSVLISIINAGTGRNVATTDKIPRTIMSRSFDLGMTLRSGVVDLDLYLVEAAAAGMPDGVIAAARALWTSAASSLDPNADASTIIRHFESFSGVEVAAGHRAFPEPSAQ